MLNKNLKFNKNETEPKMGNPTHSFREMNHLLQLVKELRIKSRGRGVSPVLFQKLERTALIFGKNTLIVVIYGLIFSFEMEFLRVSKRKNWRLFRAGPFFLVLHHMIVYKVPLF